MGREVRRVPMNWEHPRDEERHYIPLYPASRRKEGDDPKEYMPEFEDGTDVGYCMYEDTSEGTPISPVFATEEELAQWLADTGASSFADLTATYEQWMATIKRGWAPSAVINNGRMMSGVEYTTPRDGRGEGNGQ